MYQPETLSWEAAQSGQIKDISPDLIQLNFLQQLPTPEEVQQAQEDAWGFDLGLPQQALILRFNQAFHQAYIQDSDRHATFQALPTTATGINLQAFAHFCRESERRGCPIAALDQQRILERCADHPQDAFYRAFYREGDTNLIMRFRAWGPQVEVIYPQTLKAKIVQELKAAIAMYEEPYHESE